MTTETAIERARGAFERHAWNDAYALYQEAATRSALAPAELESYAEAAFWSGRPDECHALRERAYAMYDAAADQQGAARMALALARDNGLKGNFNLAGQWFTRASRAPDGEPRRAAHAKLAV